jgi:hypothetical protein
MLLLDSTAKQFNIIIDKIECVVSKDASGCKRGVSVQNIEFIIRNVYGETLTPVETGLKILLEYYSIHSDDPWLLQDKLSMCVGYKD